MAGECRADLHLPQVFAVERVRCDVDMGQDQTRVPQQVSPRIREPDGPGLGVARPNLDFLLQCSNLLRQTDFIMPRVGGVREVLVAVASKMRRLRRVKSHTSSSP